MAAFYTASILAIFLIFDSGSNAANPKTKIAAPESLKSGFKAEQQSLVSGAATNPYPRVLEALKSPLMTFFNQRVHKIMDEIQDGLRYAFQTKNKWTFPITGTGHFGSQSVLENVVDPGDTILVASNGLWGERFSEFARRIGGVVTTIRKPFGTAFTTKDVAEAIRLHKPNVVYLVHGESSTGVVNDVSRIGSICRRKNCLLIVDFVTTIGIVPVFVDKWKIDAAYSNSHKGLGCIAGFAPVTFGPRAVKKIMERKSLTPFFALDARNLSTFWKFGEHSISEGRKYIHTLPVIQLYALREALAQLANETLEGAWKRHASATKRFYDGMEEMSLSHFVGVPKSRVTGTITIVKPSHVTDLQKMLTFMLDTYQLEMSPGLGPTVGKVIRVGLFGPNADSATVDRALKALKAGLEFAKTGKVLEKTSSEESKR